MSKTHFHQINIRLSKSLMCLPIMLLCLHPMTTYSCKNMQRYYERASISKSEVITGSNDVSMLQQQHANSQVICYCASIRDIPFNRAVGRNKSVNNHRSPHSLTGPDHKQINMVSIAPRPHSTNNDFIYISL